MLSTFEIAKDYIKSLSNLDYHYDEEASSPERYFFRKGNPVQYHLSLTTPDVSFWSRQLLFRDHLIHSPSLAREYEILKTRSLSKNSIDTKMYIDKKTSFIEKVLKLAELE